jgi:hypothetical protein
MFERFTDRARKVVVLAQEEARMLDHNYIGTEHILLGLIHEGHGVAAKALVRLGADLDRVRRQVIQLLHDYQAGEEAKAGPVELRVATAGRRDGDLSQILRRLAELETRVAAVERRVGVGPETDDLEAQIADARRDKLVAVEAQDFERAAELRDREKELLARKAARQEEWAAGHPDLTVLAERLRELSEEVERLRQPGQRPAADGA